MIKWWKKKSYVEQTDFMIKYLIVPGWIFIAVSQLIILPILRHK